MAMRRIPSEEPEIAVILACEIANADLDVAEIEKDFDGIRDVMAEPFSWAADLK